MKKSILLSGQICKCENPKIARDFVKSDRERTFEVWKAWCINCKAKWTFQIDPNSYQKTCKIHTEGLHLLPDPCKDCETDFRYLIWARWTRGGNDLL